MHGNRYVTTIHCINSAIIKLARASPIAPLVVYRGSKDMRLPKQFAAKDELGRQGDVELAFMSCTSQKSVALNFAKGTKMAMILAFERGAMNNGAPLSPLSFYMNEEEICFPPLCSLEVKGRPQILFTDKGAVLQVKMGITVNQKAETIDGSLSLFSPLSLSLSLPLPLSLSPLSLALSLSLSLSRALSLPPSLPPSLPLSLSLFVSR
jgi:hypothetical protein